MNWVIPKQEKANALSVLLISNFKETIINWRLVNICLQIYKKNISFPLTGIKIDKIIRIFLNNFFFFIFCFKTNKASNKAQRILFYSLFIKSAR